MDEGPHTYTEAGNMHGEPLKMVLRWVLDAWRGLNPDIIKNSFRCCALSNAIDGMADDEIACFAPGTQLASGRERLCIAMENRNEGECIDPFTLSDIEDNPANELLRLKSRR